MWEETIENLRILKLDSMSGAQRLGTDYLSGQNTDSPGDREQPPLLPGRPSPPPRRPPPLATCVQPWPPPLVPGGARRLLLLPLARGGVRPGEDRPGRQGKGSEAGGSGALQEEAAGGWRVGACVSRGKGETNDCDNIKCGSSHRRSENFEKSMCSNKFRKSIY